ncbi:HalOD1 output domain-containing protein [Halomarina salina]|uniref:HalOD1 output domain-containing protein n=1 Tax=Halomarina salina TaxID=1872699 RepID=A0ABD5RS30_9EURY|nr:HalOD1 output domain-containing protein [Halomarina salina]
MSSSPNTTPSVRVVETVAEREQTSPLTLSPPLAEFVDPDALDALFETTSGTVTFDAWGHRITVAADGTVTAADVDPAESPRLTLYD